MKHAQGIKGAHTFLEFLMSEKPQRKIPLQRPRQMGYQNNPYISKTTEQWSSFI